MITKFPAIYGVRMFIPATDSNTERIESTAHLITMSSGSNVAVELLALLLGIQEVPGSSLSPQTSYPD